MNRSDLRPFFVETEATCEELARARLIAFGREAGLPRPLIVAVRRLGVSSVDRTGRESFAWRGLIRDGQIAH